MERNSRLGIVDNSVLHKIELGLLELIDEIESPNRESILIRETTSFLSTELHDNLKNKEIEVAEIEKIDFNVSKKSAIKLFFHSKFWKRKESVFVPKDLTIQELIDAFIDHYMLLDVLAPFEFHKVKWILLVNYREIVEREKALSELNIKDGDNFKIKGVFTKYSIKMKEGELEPVPEIEIEEACEEGEDTDIEDDYDFGVDELL